MLHVGWNLATEPCRIAGVVQHAKTYQKMCENFCRIAHVVNNVRKTQVKLQVFGNMCQTWKNMCKNHCKTAHFVENASKTQVNLNGFVEHFANPVLQRLKKTRNDFKIRPARNSIHTLNPELASRAGKIARLS